MKCRKCGREFKPESDVERLMAVGQIEQVCDQCEVRPIPKSVPLPVAPADAAQLVLRRIDWFGPDNRCIRFMALPPKRDWFPRRETLRKPRKTDQHVFVLSTSDRKLATSPPVRINCNVDTFEKQHAKFRAAKTPAMWDAFTGVSKMEVPFQQIECVEREYGETRLLLKNGEYLRLLYS